MTLGWVSAETVAYWRFEEDGDSRAGGQDFSLELSHTAQFSSDIPGASVVCDGDILPNARSYENGSDGTGSVLAASTRLDHVLGRGSFTIEGFLRLDDRAASEKFMRVIGNSVYQGSPGGWVIMVSEGRLVFTALQGLGTNPDSPLGTLTSEVSLTENEWHHFAVVGYRSPEKLVVRLFLDGVESDVEAALNFYPASPGADAIVPNPDPYLISGKNIFKGLLDEIRISDEALDPSEFLTVKP